MGTEGKGEQEKGEIEKAKREKGDCVFGHIYHQLSKDLLHNYFKKNTVHHANIKVKNSVKLFRSNLKLNFFYYLKILEELSFCIKVLP